MQSKSHTERGRLVAAIVATAVVMLLVSIMGRKGADAMAGARQGMDTAQQAQSAQQSALDME